MWVVGWNCGGLLPSLSRALRHWFVTEKGGQMAPGAQALGISQCGCSTEDCWCLSGLEGRTEEALASRDRMWLPCQSDFKAGVSRA